MRSEAFLPPEPGQWKISPSYARSSVAGCLENESRQEPAEGHDSKNSLSNHDLFSSLFLSLSFFKIVFILGGKERAHVQAGGRAEG